MVLITRKRLPLRSSEFQDYELIVLLYSLPCGSTWALITTDLYAETER